MKLMRLRSKKFLRSNSCNKIESGGAGNNSITTSSGSPTSVVGGGDQIKWELRPGGMLVQKRDEISQDSGNLSSSGSSSDGGGGEGIITLKVSTVFNSSQYSVSVQSTSTFGELKLILSMVTNLEAKEQRVLFRGKEREDHEYLHMVGVRDNDKVLLLEDPAVRERKLSMGGSPYRTISV